MTNADRAGGVVAHIVGTPYGNGVTIEDDAIPVLAEGERILLVGQSMLIEAQAEVAHAQRQCADYQAAAVVQAERAERAEADAERWRFVMDRFQGNAFVEGNQCWDLRFTWEFDVPDSRRYGALNAAVDAAIDKARGGRGKE